MSCSEKLSLACEDKHASILQIVADRVSLRGQLKGEPKFGTWGVFSLGNIRKLRKRGFLEQRGQLCGQPALKPKHLQILSPQWPGSEEVF